MFKIIVLLSLVVYASAGYSYYSFGGGGGGGGRKYEEVKEYKGTGHTFDYYTVPHYEYKYGVHDPKHHDVHEQKEERYGDKVKGEYSLHEPDGTIRYVKYEADKENGFNAEVRREGHAVHPQHYRVSKGKEIPHHY
ncbi:adult-specific cuticular protein ACP-20-like [Sitophilus oryzae]|uniref:Adult-specific cuticular protein ACP-20-like n=1 Tax=Sitophilus oryzae TaxID=7048 RepID=A0A6J2Y6W3_SITOR|nr:adult-specific cuticular protein ACP-20-like [Sitophilus oryzae]